MQLWLTPSLVAWRWAQSPWRGVAQVDEPEKTTWGRRQVCEEGNWEAQQASGPPIPPTPSACVRWPPQPKRWKRPGAHRMEGKAPPASSPFFSIPALASNRLLPPGILPTWTDAGELIMAERTGTNQAELMRARHCACRNRNSNRQRAGQHGT
jgi:hypothetical protein